MTRLAALTGVAVRGMSAGVPVHREATLDCAAFRAVTDAKRFADATGIRERRIVLSGQCASDLCAFAAEALIEGLAWDRSSIGLLVMVTQSPDYMLPATAIQLQYRMGLGTDCVAFDISLGCSAFPFGLAQASTMMQALGIQRGLLLIGDVSSRGCNPQDPSSYPLFGDAGSAVGLELDASAAPMIFDLHSDGAGGAAICVKSYGLAGRHPVRPNSLDASPVGDHSHPCSDLNTRLRGAEIFSFAIRRAPASIREVLNRAGIEAAQVDYLVLHQANRMINDVVCRKAGFAATQALSSLEHYGNTGSASIPVTLCLQSDLVQRPAKVLGCGFGVGLSWGSVLFSLAERALLLAVETDAVYRPDRLLEFS